MENHEFFVLNYGGKINQTQCVFFLNQDVYLLFNLPF